MRIIIILVIISSFIFSCKTDCQNEINSESIQYKPEELYPFNGHYINLSNLEVIVANGILANDFKNSGKYSYRLKVPLWFDGYPNITTYKNTNFKLNDNGDIELSNLNSEAIKTINNPEKISDEDNVSESSFLLSSNHGILHIKRMGNDQQFVIRKYNESGKLLHTFKFDHTKIEIEGNSNYYKPYLYFMGSTPEQIVFSTMHSDKDSTIIVNVADETLSHIQLTADGLILDEDEQFIDGFVEAQKDSKMKFNFMNYDFTADVPGFYDHAETIIKDEMIIAVYFHPIATGSVLEAYNKNTGELIWKADVKQINTGHSKYYNHVNISAFENKVIIEGIEAHGSYLQIFDIKTGERLFAEGDFNEIPD